MKYFNKKSVALIFVILIIFLVAPKPAFAQAVTFESNPLVWIANQATAIATKLGASASVATKIQQAVEWALKLATQILKRQFLDKLVDQTVEWIQGESGEDPKFITDWPGFLRDAVDQASGEFIDQLELSRLCEPFKLPLQTAFIPIPTFGNYSRTSCTMSDIRVNLENFLDDFNSGGWIAWNQMISNPQNNIYGVFLMAWDQQEIEKAAAAKNAESEAQAGKGFLGVKKCLDWDWSKYTPCADDCQHKPGATNESMASCTKECEKSSCTKWKTVTPGTVVGDAVAKAVGSDFDFIVNAEDLAAYAAAFANAIVNRITKKGVGLLDLGSTPGGTEVTEGPLPPSTVEIQAQCAQFLGTEAYKDCLTAMQSTITDIREFEKNYMLSSIEGYQDFQTQLLGIKQSDLFLLNQSADILTQYVNCGIGSDKLREAKKDSERVQKVVPIVTNQITQIQSNIIAIQTKKQEIEAITDLSQMPSPWKEFVKAVWPEFAEVVKPAIIQNLDLSSAMQDTSTRQEDLTTWYKELSACKGGEL